MAFDIPPAEPSSQELAKECGEAAENAIEWVKSMSGIELDYSPPSLMALDRVLKELIPTQSAEDREPTIVLLGSYVGEVLLEACGGRWETGDVFAGPGLRGLGGKEITVSPFLRVRQAFSNLERYHLSMYWNAVVERMRKAEPLDDRSGFRPPPAEPIRLLPVREGEGAANGPTDEELAKVIPEETKTFVEILKSDLGIELDYSLESLRFLDHYFRSLSDAIGKEGELGERRIFVYLAGNYLGEVLRRAYGGRWVYIPEHQTTGLVFSAGGEGRTVYPHKAAAEMATEYREGGVVIYADKVKKGMGVS